MNAPRTPELHIETLKWGKITWVNVEKPSSKDMHYLAKNYLFHPLELEDCLSRTERPKIDEHENYLFIVLHFPVYDKKAQVTVTSQVSIFIAADLLVTVHTGGLKPLSHLFNDCQQNESACNENMLRSTGYLLYRILDRLVDYCFPIVRKIISNAEDIEDRLFSEPNRDSVRELSILRRDILSTRRIIRPQRTILKSLEIKDYPFLKEDLDVYFGDIGDHIGKMTETLDEYDEVVEGLNATSDSLFSHRTNQVIKILTLLGTIILPMLVIQGLYSMNIPLPMQDSPWSFLVIILVTISVSAAMIIYFRHRHWI